MKRAALCLGLAAAAGVLFWLFPLFHIVPIRQAEARKQQEAFNAGEFAAKFWNGPLQTALEAAPQASDVLSAIAKDPRRAREQFGRTVGFSSSCCFFLRGAGTIQDVSARAVGVSLSPQSNEPEVVLLTGLLFGNAIRDGTGLLSPNDFPNSQHFNDLSTELNRLVEARVLPDFKAQAARGRRVTFVGCAEVGEDDGDLRPLKVVPLRVRVE